MTRYFRTSRNRCLFTGRAGLFFVHVDIGLMPPPSVSRRGNSSGSLAIASECSERFRGTIRNVSNPTGESSNPIRESRNPTGESRNPKCNPVGELCITCQGQCRTHLWRRHWQTFSRCLVQMRVTLATGYMSGMVDHLSQCHKIRRWEFVDMGELLPEFSQRDNETAAKRPWMAKKPRQVTDIFSWMQCFTTYVSVLGPAYPEAVPELMAYAATIIRVSQEFFRPGLAAL